MLTLRAMRSWGRVLDQVVDRIGVRFRRRDLRAHAGRYFRGLISRGERKNGWQLAEELGDVAPVNLQHFIARAEWSADAVRDDLQSYVLDTSRGDKDGTRSWMTSNSRSVPRPKGQRRRASLIAFPLKGRPRRGTPGTVG